MKDMRGNCLPGCKRRSHLLPRPPRRSARALLGFARRFRAEVRPTADWIAELREGEQD
jgi:hypothetical protein